MPDIKLTEIYDFNGKVKVQFDEETGNLYVNGKQVVTEIKFTPIQKFLTYGVSIAIIVEAAMSVVAAIYR